MGLSHRLAYDQGSSSPNVTAITVICIPAHTEVDETKGQAVSNCTRYEKASESSESECSSMYKSKKIARSRGIIYDC